MSHRFQVLFHDIISISIMSNKFLVLFLYYIYDAVQFSGLITYYISDAEQILGINSHYILDAEQI
jgi:hypothetical protein